MKFKLLTKDGVLVSEGSLALPWIPEVLFYGSRPFLQDDGVIVMEDPDLKVYIEATHWAVPRN